MSLKTSKKFHSQISKH